MDDMGMMSGDGGADFAPLTPAGINFSNQTQAYDFLQGILDDSYFQVESNAFARYFWYAIACAIGLATIFNFSQRCLLKYRHQVPALITSPFDALVAVFRECSSLQLTPNVILPFGIPQTGSVLLILAYFGLIIAFEFSGNNYPGAQHYQAYSIRAAWLAVAQVPLIVLLAGKRNLIGLLTGTNYQKLNVLHRWVARGLLVLATMHFGFESTGWSKYGLMRLEWSTDTCPPTGMAAYAILLWINIVNLWPTRRISYAFFVIQHILMFVGFIVALMIHLPPTALYSRVYIWIGIGLYLLDRTIRILQTIWMNKTMAVARVENLDGVATRLTISNKSFKSWSPGAHVLLSIPRFGLLQTHPATIVSTPKSHGGDLIFILKAHRGFTRSLLKSATMKTLSTLKHKDQSVENQPIDATHKCVIDGPYSSSQLNLQMFEVVTLIAGGTGVTFTLSQLLALAESAAKGRPIPKVVDFVWCIKRSSCLKWIEVELTGALRALRQSGCRATCTVYITGHSQPESALENDIGSLPESLDDTGVDPKTFAKTETTDNFGETSSIALLHGRPEINTVLLSSIEKSSKGETAIAVCGPLTLTKTVRNTYVRICDDRAVCKGSGATGVYLHVENPCN